MYHLFKRPKNTLQRALGSRGLLTVLRKSKGKWTGEQRRGKRRGQFRQAAGKAPACGPPRALGPQTGRSQRPRSSWGAGYSSFPPQSPQLSHHFRWALWWNCLPAAPRYRNCYQVRLLGSILSWLDYIWSCFSGVCILFSLRSKVGFVPHFSKIV